MKRVIGFENPNSFVKICSDPNTLDYGKKVYPNTLSKPPRQSMFNNSKKIYEVNGNPYIVGKTRFYETSSSKGIQRYQSENFYVEGVIALAQVAEDGDEIIAVTGLPAKHYTEEIKQIVRNVFEKEHTVYENGKPKKFAVSKCIVLLQPMGTYINLLKDLHGNTRFEASRLISKNVLVFDIGWGSSDYAVIRENDLYEWGEADFSMFDLYDEIRVKLQVKYPDKPIATGKIELFDLEQQIRENNYYEYSNESYYVGDIKQDIFSKYAGKIMTSLGQKVDLLEFDQVLFCGGGVQALKPYLKNHLVNRNSLPVLNAQTSNVEGFYIFGKYFAG